MIDLSDFLEYIKKTSLATFHDAIQEAITKRLEARRYGELSDWLNVIKQLPNVDISDALLDTDCISLLTKKPFTPVEIQALKKNLMTLHPWRKGPFDLFGLHIDTEWHSDWKWQRLVNHISDLKGRTVLDIGCGSGYHCWRMRGAGAKLVIGIDPMVKFVMQFLVFKKYLHKEPVFVLPLLCEDLPRQMQAFDTVFSMGVLYHRRSPIDHLEELKQLLKPSGELILETLIIEGDKNSVLVPEERYAKMRNVWFLPSLDQLVTWLKKIGFKDIRLVDINKTSVKEQRKTDWMQFQSLSDFLDPDDTSKTIEGYPAPTRATLVAKR